MRAWPAAVGAVSMTAMHGIARGLQLIGLVLPLTGFMLAESSFRDQAMTVELGLLALGAGIFWAGWRLQRRADP